MSYTALYRKFRPTVFEDVKGQEHIVTTLKNQIRADRIGHAYLFCGTRGTGKTTIAKIFAKAVNCEHPVDGSPCGECETCKAIAAGASMNVIEIDAASNNGVDNIREIVEEVAYSPAAGKYKVYIIDEVHMLSIGAFNALLKTLEEPPSYVIFILATTEVHKIPITILSRCQRYDFRRITIDTIADRIRELTGIEKVPIEDKAIRYIAKTADGSMRDALSLLDQCIAFHFGQELTYDKVLDVLGAVDTEVFSRLLRAVLEEDVSKTLAILDGIEDIIDMSTDNLNHLKEEAELTDYDRIMRYIRVLSDLSGQIRYAAQKRVLIEIALIKLCRPQMEVDTSSLSERIRDLEEKLEKGIVQTIPAKGGSSPQQSTAQPEPQAPLPEAVPEDIRMVAGKWSVAISELPNPMKTYLKGAYPSLSEDGKLMVVLGDGLPFDYFRQEGHKEELEKHLSGYAGKAMEVVIKNAQAGRNPEAVFPNLTRLISDNIQIEIEEEEEPEEDPLEEEF